VFGLLGLVWACRGGLRERRASAVESHQTKPTLTPTPAHLSLIRERDSVSRGVALIASSMPQLQPLTYDSASWAWPSGVGGTGASCDIDVSGSVRVGLGVRGLPPMCITLLAQVR